MMNFKQLIAAPGRIQKAYVLVRTLVLPAVVGGVAFTANIPTATALMSQSPMTVQQPAAPLVMLSVGRDERLYFPAYNNYSDVDGDGSIDTDYKPATITYFGLFDSYKCYNYVGANKRFEPRGAVVNATLKTCGSAVAWSGDWLNYVTTSRMDALRRVFYGGKRIETSTTTVLERAYIPQDAHSWGAEYNTGRSGYDIAQYTPFAAPASSSNQHLFGNTTINGGTDPLLRVLLNRPERVFNWVAKEGPVLDTLIDPYVDQNGVSVGGGTVAPVDYVIRVLVCVNSTSIPMESECKGYPTISPTVWRPTGVLHDYGENRSVAFGLITGSYDNSRAGGVVRKNMSYFDQEIDANTGMFVTTSTGIVGTFDRLKIAQWQAGGYNCNGGCKDYGNPIAEIMYEGLRYLGSGGTPTPAFSYSAGGTDDALGLPKPSWINPYASVASGGGGFPVCSRPTQMVVSDVNPTFDSDQLPGSLFGAFSPPATPTSLSAFSTSAVGQNIWNAEGLGSKNYFIGESLANVGNTYDQAPTPKLANSFGNIRGLAPGDPTRQGSYGAAAVANFGAKNPITTPGNKPVDTYAIALAPSIPTLKIPTSLGTVSIAPFGKSTGGCNYGEFVAGTTYLTNRIVGFYFDSVTNVPGFPTNAAVNGGRAIGTFRVSFEDNEQGTDDDMDAIVRYAFQVNADGTLKMSLKSEYAAGCIDQNMGFVISGTTIDGAYLGVRDIGGAGSAYVLNDSANSYDLNGLGQRVPATGGKLGLLYERTFTPSGATTAGGAIPQNPLWYAAKYGTSGAIPDTSTLPPPNYAFVNNPARLRAQIASALDAILASAQAPSAIGTSGSVVRTGSSLAFSSNFLYSTRSVLRRNGNPITASVWNGGLDAYRLNDNGTLGNTVWSANVPGGTSATAAGADFASRPVVTWINGAYRTLNVANLASDSTLIAKLAPVSMQTRLLPKLTELFGTAIPVGIQAQRTAEAVANYLKGDQSLEIGNTPNGTLPGVLRVRETVLGDIVGSVPAFQGRTDLGYGVTTQPGSASYAAYATAKRSLPELLWIGANDGMLHAFDARTGNLTWSFIPKALQGQVVNLASPSYQHQYFMNGKVTVADIFTGSAWKTIVIASAGAGARTIVAIDATNPSSPSVLWEVAAGAPGQPFDDLGFVLGKLNVIRVNDASTSTQWAIVFGNGYESSTSPPSPKSVARLMVLDAVTGTALGTASKLTVPDSATYNGLSSPALIGDDIKTASADRITVQAWAGDLGGNLWRFRLAGAPSTWQVDSYSSSSNTARPLITVKRSPTGGGAAIPQPITAEPEVFRSFSSGYQVTFGTGKFFEDADRSSTDIQTVYSVRDNATFFRIANASASLIASETNLGRGNLGTIAIATQTGVDGGTGSRTLSGSGSARGWYLDFVSPGALTTDPAERVLARPSIYFPFVYVGTFKPTANSCLAGSSGWLMALDLETGQGTTAFDTNGDGTAETIANGARTAGGIDGPISLVANASGDKIVFAGLPSPIKGVSGSDAKSDRSTAQGGLLGVKTGAGRLSWRQIQ